MKINEGNAELIDYSKKLDHRLRKETARKEDELNSLNQVYEKKIEGAKTQGEENYTNALSRNDDLLLSASKDYENKLNDYKEKLSKTQNSLMQEELTIKNDQLQKIENSKEQHANNLHEQFRNAKAFQEEINGQMKNSVETITDKSLVEKRHIETKAKSQVNALANEYNSKGAAEEREYRSKLNNNVRIHQEDVNLQQTELKKEAAISSEKNKRLTSEKLNIQKEELNYLDNHQRDILTQKQSDFKIRYQNLVKEHNDLISELKTHFETDVKKMVEQTSSQKRIIANKSEDSFYRVDTLSPKISENEKEYMVSLTVPEHEKENVHLSVHGRNVKMTLTRRFSETYEEIDGSSNRSTKNELFSREFPCKDILNPKLVDQKYENGVLTYRIQKL